MTNKEVIDVLVDIYISQNPDKSIPFENRNNFISAIKFSKKTGLSLFKSVEIL